MTYIFDTMEENCKRTRTKNLSPQMISCFPQQCCWTLPLNTIAASFVISGGLSWWPPYPILPTPSWTPRFGIGWCVSSIWGFVFGVRCAFIKIRKYKKVCISECINVFLSCYMDVGSCWPFATFWVRELKLLSAAAGCSFAMARLLLVMKTKQLSVDDQIALPSPYSQIIIII